MYMATATAEKPIAETTAQRAELFLETGERKKPLATAANLKMLMQFQGYHCRYNVITKHIEITIPGDRQYMPENAEQAKLSQIISMMKQVGMPTDHYLEHLLNIADECPRNPVMDWITSKPWDGKDRLHEFCLTIKAKNEDAKNLFLRRWLITAVCLASKNGVDAPGILVLQGAQGIGKTWWFRKLCPLPEMIRTDASVDPRNRDSVSQVISHWIVELGEIGNTFRRADLDALKAFITADKDKLRRPYATTDQVYPRRTALAASVNDRIFLHDPTGNRRFFTIQCIAINSYHDIDMQQLWAQVYVMVKQGETTELSDKERELIDSTNQDHVQIDPIEEMIVQFYDWDNFFTGDWKTATQVCKDISLKIITQKETRSVAAIIRKLNKEDPKSEKRTKAQRLFLLPQPKGAP